MLPVAALIDGVERPPPGVVGVSAERPLAVLDVAAAPGGKTTQLAAWLRARGEGGLVVANERSSSRLAQTMALIKQRGGRKVVLRHWARPTVTRRGEDARSLRATSSRPPQVVLRETEPNFVVGSRRDDGGAGGDAGEPRGGGAAGRAGDAGGGGDELALPKVLFQCGAT